MVYIVRHMEDGVDDALDQSHAWTSLPRDAAANASEDTSIMLALVTEAAREQFNILGFLDCQLLHEDEEIQN